MSGFYLTIAALLLLTVLAGLVRVVRGPGPADRMIAAQLLGTTGLAVVLLVGAAAGERSAVDIAIVFALLAALATVVFVRCSQGVEPPEEAPPERRGPDAGPP